MKMKKKKLKISIAMRGLMRIGVWWDEVGRVSKKLLLLITIIIISIVIYY